MKSGVSSLTCRPRLERIGKRGEGTTESYSFLIGILITIMILVPIGIGIYNYYTQESQPEKFLEKLTNSVSSINDNDNFSLVALLGANTAVVAFEKSSVDIGTDGIWNCMDRYIDGRITKPVKCLGKACICLCELPRLGLPYSVSDLCRGSPCLEVKTGYDISFKGGKMCKYGGFYPASSGAPLDDIGAYPIYIERKGSVVSFCDNLPCIPENLRQARDTFDGLIKEYRLCRISTRNDCMCSESDVSKMPSGYSIVIEPSSHDTLFSLLFGGDVIGREKVEEDSFCFYRYSADSFSSVPAVKAEIKGGVSDSEYIHSGKVQLFRSSDKKTCFVWSAPPGLEKLKTENSYCSASPVSPGQGGSVPLLPPQ